MTHNGLHGDGFAPDDLAEIEALVRAAGDYIEPSRDLRPRVLEAVRGERRSRLSRYRMLLATAAMLGFVSLVGWRVEAIGNRVSSSSSSQRIAMLTAENERAAHGRGFKQLCWSLVDAFFEVRQEQAESLGVASPRGSNPEEAAQSAEASAQEAAREASK